MAESNLAAWRGILDELDRQLTRARRSPELGSHPSGIWSIDEIRQCFGPLGEMPEEVVERAARILGELDETIAQITAARHTVGDHLALLDSVRGASAPHPVYLDRVG